MSTPTTLSRPAIPFTTVVVVISALVGSLLYALFLTPPTHLHSPFSYIGITAVNVLSAALNVSYYRSYLEAITLSRLTLQISSIMFALLLGYIIFMRFTSR